MKKLAPYIMMMILLAGTALAAGGFGISPSIIQEDELVRGETYTRSLKILSSEEVDTEVEVSVSGDAADWIKLLDPGSREEITEPIIIPGKGERYVVVEIPVPEDLANGVYQGHLAVQSTTIDDPTINQVSLVVRTRYMFDVTGTERKTGDVKSVVAEDTESGQKARIKYDMVNTGNVAFAPMARVRIQNVEGTVDTVESEGALVRPGQTIVQVVEWDTEGRGTGTFTAFAVISVEGQQIGEGQDSFDIAPRGTYTAEFLAGEPELPDALVVDKLAKGSLSFRNTGKIDLLAKVQFEVLQGGELVDVITGEETLVAPTQSKDLEFFFKPTESGEYVLEGTLLYSGREEQLEPLTVTVRSEAEATVNTDDFADDSGDNTLLWIGGAVILVLVLVILFLVLRKK